MKRALAFCLSIILMLFTYALGSTTLRVADGQLGHSQFDGAVLFIYWLVLITAWCLVLWMFERKGGRSHVWLPALALVAVFVYIAMAIQ